MAEPDESTPLSQSPVFPWLRKFYAASGITAWDGTVPFHVTSNPELANSYALVIIRFLQEATATGRIDPSQPFYVVELGAGSGKLAFHLVKRLRELRQTLGLQHLELIYVMSDVAEANIDHWRRHPRLQPFIERGELLLARFDAETDNSFHLVPASDDPVPIDGDHGQLSTFANPLVVVANYVFDSLPQDLFRVTDGRIEQMVATTAVVSADGGDGFGADGGDGGEANEAARLIWSARPVVAPHYGEPELDALLAEAAAGIGPQDEAVMFPVVALRVLRRLADAAGGRLCLLAADLGFATGVPAEPELQVKAGEAFFYLPVDLSVIGRLFARLGPGIHRHRRARSLDASLSVCGFSPDELRETRYAFVAHAETFGARGRKAVGSLLNGAGATLDPEEWLAIAGLLRYDNILLAASVDLFTGWGRANALSPDLRTELVAALRLFGAEIYWTPGAPDSYFDLATVLHELGQLKPAVASYVQSLETVGPSTEAYVNLAQALRDLHRPNEAIEALRDALLLDPRHVVARGWLGRIELEMSGELPPEVPNDGSHEPGSSTAASE